MSNAITNSRFMAPQYIVALFPESDLYPKSELKEGV
jgi:hypothetical protein